MNMITGGGTSVSKVELLLRCISNDKHTIHVSDAGGTSAVARIKSRIPAALALNMQCALAWAAAPPLLPALITAALLLDMRCALALVAAPPLLRATLKGDSRYISGVHEQFANTRA